MNAEIYPAIELALKKHVERAVRPLRATEQRKLRIREELFAHLLGIYNREREHLDASAALAAACARFGSPPELTRELSATLLFPERLAALVEQYERAQDRFWSRSPKESLLRYLFRSVASIALFTFVLIFGVVGVFSLFGSPSNNETTWTFLAQLYPLIVLGECSAVFAAVAVEKLTAHQIGLRRWLLLAAHVGGWSVLLTTATASVWWWIGGQPFSADQALRVSLSIVAAVGFVLTVVAVACDHSRHCKAMYDAWRLLPIDE